MPSISIAKGRGSLNHNKRVFKHKNVDAERSALNRVLVDQELKTAYHELFDDALQRYNQKQQRADRRIDNYLSHIRHSKQEKEFHELVVQIGNKDDVPNLDPDALADMLQQYLDEFQTRNPQMKIFYAVIHMDEATPHLHLDYIPYITGQKRGLDTRVSNDKAIQQMGYKTWTAWKDNEMESLTNILHRHGLERTIMNDDTIHLSVAAYKKMQREVERVTEPLRQTVTTQKKRIDELEEQLNRSVPKETADRLYNDNKQMKQTISKLKSDNQELQCINNDLIEKNRNRGILGASKDAQIHQLERENTQLKADLKQKDGLIEKLKHCLRTIIEFACEWLDISFKQFDKELFDHDEAASYALDELFDDEPIKTKHEHTLTR